LFIVRPVPIAPRPCNRRHFDRWFDQDRLEPTNEFSFDGLDVQSLYIYGTIGGPEVNVTVSFDKNIAINRLNYLLSCNLDSKHIISLHTIC